MKLTPWFPGHIKPVRNGLYEIRGCRFGGDNFRFWLGDGWSATYASVYAASCEIEFPLLPMTASYKPGQDMTEWRGVAK